MTQLVVRGEERADSSQACRRTGDGVDTCVDVVSLGVERSASTAHGGEAAHAVDGIDPLANGLARFPAEFSKYLHTVHWADFGCFLGLVAIVAGVVIFNVRRTNLLPVRDPRLAESLNFLNF